MGIKQRWDNRETQCVLCEKKLVAKEKYLCKSCKNKLGITGEVTAAVAFGLLIRAGLKLIKNIKA